MPWQRCNGPEPHRRDGYAVGACPHGWAGGRRVEAVNTVLFLGPDGLPRVGDVFKRAHVGNFLRFGQDESRFLQGVLDPLLFGDILEADENAAVLAGNAAVTRPPVPIRVKIFEIPALSGGDAPILPLQLRSQGRGKGLPIARAHHLIPADGKHSLGSVIDIDNPPIGITGKATIQ